MPVCIVSHLSTPNRATCYSTESELKAQNIGQTHPQICTFLPLFSAFFYCVFLFCCVIFILNMSEWTRVHEHAGRLSVYRPEIVLNWCSPTPTVHRAVH